MSEIRTVRVKVNMVDMLTVHCQQQHIAVYFEECAVSTYECYHLSHNIQVLTTVYHVKLCQKPLKSLIQ